MRPMKLEEWALIAEIVGAIAVSHADAVLEPH